MRCSGCDMQSFAFFIFVRTLFHISASSPRGVPTLTASGQLVQQRSSSERKKQAFGKKVSTGLSRTVLRMRLFVLSASDASATCMRAATRPRNFIRTRAQERVAFFAFSGSRGRGVYTRCYAAISRFASPLPLCRYIRKAAVWRDPMNSLHEN